MASEDNRRVITQFMDVLQTRKYDDLLPLATPDATWWVAGPQDKLPFCGGHLLSDRAAQMKESFGKASSVSYQIRDIISEGNTVVLESVTRAEGPLSGQFYENEILTIFTFVDGKIQSIREYLDTTQIFKIPWRSKRINDERKLEMRPGSIELTSIVEKGYEGPRDSEGGWHPEFTTFRSCFTLDLSIQQTRYSYGSFFFLSCSLWNQNGKPCIPE